MPAGAGTIRAGQAYVELMLKNRIPAGLRKAAAQLKAFGATVSAMGTRLIGWGSAVAAPLLATTKVFASMGDDAIKMSKRTGLSVEALSQLKYAADLSGTSIEDVEKAVKRMQMSMIVAARGS